MRKSLLFRFFRASEMARAEPARGCARRSPPLLCGDALYPWRQDVIVEGRSIADPDGGDAFDEHHLRVRVGDGRLTITAGGSAATSVCRIEVRPVPFASATQEPRVRDGFAWRAAQRAR